MNTLLAGTWSLISSSEEVISRARRVSQRIQGFLERSQDELSLEELKFLGLQKRLDSLIPTLNLLLRRTLLRDSCVQQVVQNTQDLLFDVCSFVERCCPEKLSPSPAAGAVDFELLDHYLHELEFACSSVTMATNLLNVTAFEVPVTSLDTLGHLPENDGESASESSVSLRALLTASERIQDVFGRAGDLSASPGQLFSKAPNCEWRLLMDSATLHVRADEKPGFLRYALHVSRSSPRTAGWESTDTESSSAEASALSSPLDFQIEVALDALLQATSELNLPAEPGGSQVLVWKGGSPEVSAAASEFPDAELVIEDAGSSPSSRRAWQRRARRFLSAGLGPSEAQGSTGYAFVFAEDLESFVAPGQPALKPREVLYMARLCAFDAGHQQFSKFDAAGQSGENCPPHISSSDELLVTLLTMSENTVAT